MSKGTRDRSESPPAVNEDDDDAEYRASSSRSKRQRTSTKSYKEVNEDSKNNQKTVLFETYHGYIEDPMDALYVVQGTVLGKLTPFAGTAEEMAQIRIRSGTVIVMAENSPFVKRWRVSSLGCKFLRICSEFLDLIQDGIRWSPSRAFGPFILCELFAWDIDGED
ncbi:hypothetical protein BCR33DRAFT_570282 [Rhizoclosmatium globosum]|uniref:Uncharacterized protein n=1 Tax=Rhizoclosmatium globosum TaxID=329046 RepID=A0A1Y2B5M6_9FUNG|nr:hypothetical protein BCR33DRAFT_570282 [Rhizoclosmatium globosum]|eukprot:ORY30139.1 hypothetical protein BCR33DRAFT_570282 [Rhizoclosmatium globosum]